MASASGATPWWLLLLLLSLLLLLLLSLIAHINRPSAISTWKRPRHRGSRNSQQAWPSNLDVDLANDSTPCGRHRAITSWGHTDGFGAQYAAMLSVFAWSLMHNLTYCSMSWHSMAHDLDAKLMFEFVGGRLFGPPATAATPRLYHAHGEMGCMTGTRVQQKCQYGKVPDARRLARRYYLQAALNRSAELFADSRFFHVGHITSAPSRTPQLAHLFNYYSHYARLHRHPVAPLALRVAVRSLPLNWCWLCAQRCCPEPSLKIVFSLAKRLEKS
eukprot:6197650-Pleurochrysis_carterae.AAC.4